MTLDELTSFVQLIIQDSSFDAYIPSYLNQAQLEVAGGMKSTLGSWITPPLAGLLTIDTLTTVDDTAYIELPSNYHRRVQFVSNSNNVEIEIAKDFITFSETYPGLSRSGKITSVIDQGNLLYYQAIPSTPEVLTVQYYRKPTDMNLTTDEPDGIPIHLQKSLLVNHACWKIFELIEDGLEGPGVNTQRYMELFYQALELLELTVPYLSRSFNTLKDN